MFNDTSLKRPRDRDRRIRRKALLFGAGVAADALLPVNKARNRR